MANKLWVTTIWDDGTNYQYLAKEPSNVWIPFYESDDEGAERFEKRCTAETYQSVLQELNKKYEIATGGVEVGFLHRGKQHIVHFGGDNSTAHTVHISAKQYDMPEGVYAGFMRSWLDGEEPYDSLADGWY